jgi:hypothetical protein
MAFGLPMVVRLMSSRFVQTNNDWQIPGTAEAGNRSSFYF